jgi:aminoglycoside phosphotransferase (APT) family kinase protein
MTETASNRSLESCLPAHLQGSTSKLTRVAAGLSGAGVYRVESGPQSFVLKVAASDAPLESWRSKLQTQQLAANAGLAPAIVHVDEPRRAVLSTFIVDRSFPALYFNPQTHAAALNLLGRTLRRVHDLPPPPLVEKGDPRGVITRIWSGLRTLALPAFVSEAVERTLAQQPPAQPRALVLSHNDVNPTNLAYDGERLLLLDWDTSSLNDPLYDLAAASLFLRMDERSRQGLWAAYTGEPVSMLPVDLAGQRRLVGALCGAVFLQLARHSGHAGATGAETLESTPPLAELYRRLRAGELSVASAEGQWGFGLALVKESLSGD